MKKKLFFGVLMLGTSITILSCAKKDNLDNDSDDQVIVADSVNKKDSSLSEGSASHLTSDQVRDLPQSVNNFLHQHYPNVEIKKLELKNDAELGNYYEFDMINGAEISIDKQAKWLKVEDSNGIPNDIVPDKIKTYINTSHKGTSIVSIENNKTGYDVKIKDGKDLKFDVQGNYVK